MRTTSVRRYIAPISLLAFVFLTVVRLSEESPSAIALKAMQAQRIVDALRWELAISEEVQVAPVAYHPFVFAVEPQDPQKERFFFSMEWGFLQMLTDRELRAALAHELGHVWIFTHHPFLQAERLANDIGQRVVAREDLERMYVRLWTYEGTSRVAMAALLGTDDLASGPEIPQTATSAETAVGRDLVGMPRIGLTSKSSLSLEGSGQTVWAEGFEGVVVGLDGELYEAYHPSKIKRTQESLRKRGLYGGPINGTLDSPTMRAIYEFQEASYGLRRCGIPTPRTRKLLEQGSHTS